ncbi:MAG: glycosyltransferase [Parvibaculaceae bacterium]
MAKRPPRDKGAGAKQRRRVSPGAAQFAYDVALMGDMTIRGEAALRIASEAAAHAAAGRRVALAHLPTQGSLPLIAPDIQACVSLGLADPIDPARRVTAAECVIHGIHRFNEMPARLRGLNAPRAVIVIDRAPSATLGATRRWLSGLFETLLFAPAGAAERAALAKAHPDFALTADDWLLPAPAPTEEPATIGHRFRIGAVGTTAGDWPSANETMARLFPEDGGFDVRLLGRPPPRAMRLSGGWTILDPETLSVGRYLDGLDALLHFPSAPEAPQDAIIAAMLGKGRPVLMPPSLRPRYGPGPLYCEPGDAAGLLRRYIVDPVIRRSTRTAALAAASRLTRPVAPAAEGPRQRGAPVALFLASNGTGLGHVTRLLAVARRMTTAEPVFVSMAQTADTIESFGFTAEYVPNAHYLGVPSEEWDGWFQAELEHLIDAYNAGVVVYDGNGPTPGLVRAAGSRGCGLVWLRQGMVGDATMSFIGNAVYCDAIIEPGELASAADSGTTAARRDETAAVDPILLLEPDELLSREEAATTIGLDPARPAVLIQLGSGSNRDIVAMIDRIVTELRRFPGVQVAIAEWSTAAALPPLWPEARILRGHPFAQYYRAFDFTISAAGYNMFHEIVAYGVPTIFIANTHPTMDDQRGRARFAQENDLALDLDERDLHELPVMISALLAAPARAFLAENCRKAGIVNGARVAARIVEARMRGGVA